MNDENAKEISDTFDKQARFVCALKYNMQPKIFKILDLVYEWAELEQNNDELACIKNKVCD